VFLLFWLGGWYQGAKSALHGLLEKGTPLGEKIFFGVWLAGWTVGGLGAAALVVARVWRRGEETLLLGRAKLFWTPATLWQAWQGYRSRSWAKTLRHFRKSRSFVLPLWDITSIEIEQPIGDDPGPFLTLRCQGRRFLIGTELDDAETDWLLKLLWAWKNSASLLNLPE
jgi:hypothetical protein